MNRHEEFMAYAIKLSIDNVTSGNGGPFGAVITKDDTIIAYGANQVTASNDPTAHAEIVTIRQACGILKNFHLTGCTLYTSCEPCPMCFGAIYFAHLDTVYYANTKADAQSVGFDDEFIYDQIIREHLSRTIPMKQLMRSQASVAMNLWQQSTHKIKY